MSDADLKEMFEAIDTDKSGMVDATELQTIIRACNNAGYFGDKLDEAGIEDTAKIIIEDSDTGNRDGKLTLDEFKNGMRKIMGP